MPERTDDLVELYRAWDELSQSQKLKIRFLVATQKKSIRVIGVGLLMAVLTTILVSTEERLIGISTFVLVLTYSVLLTPLSKL